MFGEETIHEPVANDEDLDFSMDDIDAEDIVSDEAPQDFDDEPEATPAPVSTEKLLVKYNGAEQEIDLSQQREDVVSWIQKGMNYDHVIQERDSLKNSEEMAYLKQLATEAGFDNTKEYIQTMATQRVEKQINERVQQLMTEGMSEQHARYTAKLEMESRKEPEKPREFKLPDEEVQKQEQTRAFTELLNEYPELTSKKWSDFPDEFKQMVADGKKPLVAWQKYLLTEKAKEEAKAEQARKAKERDLGSMKTGTADDKTDDFVSELFG